MSVKNIHVMAKQVIVFFRAGPGEESSGLLWVLGHASS